MADKCAGIILCAGSGSRMNLEINKLFIELFSKPIVAYSLMAFEKCPLIDEIVLVARKQDIASLKEIAESLGITKLSKIVCGGKTRQESSKIGVEATDKACKVVAIHDGARPFVSPKDIEKAVVAAKAAGASVLAVRAVDTHVVANEDETLKSPLNRDFLWAVQTPQCFLREIIVSAHEKALSDGFEGTDDTALAYRAGYTVKLVEGSSDNIKITTCGDLSRAEEIIKRGEPYANWQRI